VQRGWIYGGEMALGDIGEEPAFQGLRGHPRFERIRARIAAHFARERAEIRPLLAELGRAATEASTAR
jgi:hypothetical protein